MKKTKQISPIISEELWHELLEIAEQESRSLSGQVRVMLKKSVKEWEKKDKP